MLHGEYGSGKPATAARITDAVIYELHIRDFAMDESSGMENAGKYLEFTENFQNQRGRKLFKRLRLWK